MTFPVQNAAASESLPRTDVGRARGIVGVGSIVASLLLATVLVAVLMGRSGRSFSIWGSVATRPGADPSGTSSAQLRRGAESAGGSIETYPIPPEAVTNPIFPPGSAEAAAGLPAGLVARTTAGRSASWSARPERGRTPPRGNVGVSRADARQSRGQALAAGLAASSHGHSFAPAAPEPPSASNGERRAAEPTSQPGTAAGPTQIRIPLVEDQPRVRIVE